MKTKKSVVFAGVMAMLLGLAIVGCDASADGGGKPVSPGSGTGSTSTPKSKSLANGNATLTITEIIEPESSLKSSAMFSVSNPQTMEKFKYTLFVGGATVSSGMVIIGSAYWAFVPATTGAKPFNAKIIGGSLVFPSEIGGIGVESFTIPLTTDNTNGGNNGGSGDETSDGANGGNNGETGGGNGDGSGGTGDSGNEGGTTGGNDDGNSEETEGGSEKKDVWWGNKYAVYTVANGVATSVSYEYGIEYTNYVDRTHYEWRYSYTAPINTFFTYDTHTVSTIGSTTYEFSFRLNGENGQSSTHSISSSTTTFDYFDNSRFEDFETTTVTEFNGVLNYVYDMDSWLIKRQTLNSIITMNGNTTYSEEESIYTITLLSDVGGLKTYKRYITNTGGNGPYEIHTIKDGVILGTSYGVTLGTSYYDSNGALSYTLTYTFPNDSIIRERLPAFTVYSVSYTATPSSNNYQTCELLESTDSLLKIRMKTFNPSGVLIIQEDRSYGKM